MATINTRIQSIHKLATGSFDVTIIGSGIVEASLFAALAARGVSVALLSPGDFASTMNQRIPNHLSGGLADLGSRGFLQKRKINRSRNRIIENKKNDDAQVRYLNAIKETDPSSLYGTVARILTHWPANKIRRPKLLHTSSLRKQEPLLRVNNLKGGIESKDTYLSETAERFTLNLLNHARNVIKNNAITANYVTVTSATVDAHKPWLLQVEDTLTGERFPVLSKIVIDSHASQNTTSAFRKSQDAPELAIHNTHITIPNFLNKKRFLRIVHEDDRQITLSPLKNVLAVTNSTTIEEGKEIETNKEVSSTIDTLNAQFLFEKPLRETDVLSQWATTCHLPLPKETKKTYTLRSVPVHYSLEADAEKKLLLLSGAQPAHTYALVEHILKVVPRMGIALKPANYNWIQGPPTAEKEYFLTLAQQSPIQKNTEEYSLPFAEILWNRHRSNSFKILDLLERRASLATPLFEGSDILWAEIPIIKNLEMTTSIEDFLYRRTQLGRTFGENLCAHIPQEKLQRAILTEPQASAQTAGNTA